MFSKKKHTGYSSSEIILFNIYKKNTISVSQSNRHINQILRHLQSNVNIFAVVTVTTISSFKRPQILIKVTCNLFVGIFTIECSIFGSIGGKIHLSLFEKRLLPRCCLMIRVSGSETSPHKLLWKNFVGNGLKPKCIGVRTLHTGMIKSFKLLYVIEVMDINFSNISSRI